MGRVLIDRKSRKNREKIIRIFMKKI